MTDRLDEPSTSRTDERDVGPVEFDDGRYLYCIVRTTGTESEPLDVTGVDDEPVWLVSADDAGLAAVVHACDALYDASDISQVKRWLIDHQSVIDDAAAAFGTPLPVRFDTIIRGDDGVVRHWLRDEQDRLTRTLDAVAGHWEYRIDVIETDPVAASTLLEHDETLRSIRDRIDDADEGRTFLLENQYDDRVRSLRSARCDHLTADLDERLEEFAREVRILDRSTVASQTVDALGGDRSGSDAGETLCRIALLSRAASESDVGSVLDDVAANEGIEVRYSGPWPPYSFTPDLSGDESGREPLDESDTRIEDGPKPTGAAESELGGRTESPSSAGAEPASSSSRQLDANRNESDEDPESGER